MQVSWPFFEHNPFLLYLLAVIFCAWYGGLGPGLVCVAVSFLLSDFLFVEPYSVFQFHKQGDFVRVVLFLVIGPTICLLSELIHRERRRSVVNLNALRASEERYRKLADNFPNGAVITYDKNFRVTFIAGRGLQEAGLSADFFLGKRLSEIAPPEVVSLVEPHFQTAFAGQLVTYECPYPDGKTYSAAVAPLLNGKGLIDEILVAFQDITERKRSEEALRESESFRRLVIESEPECVKVIAPNYALLDMNPAELKMIEATSREQVIGRSVLTLVAPECRNIFMEMHERVCRGESVVTEFEIVGLKGTRRWMESHAAPLLDKESNVISQLAITRDVTERKRAQESLTLFRNLIDQSSDAIEVLEPDTLRFLDCNATAHQVLGYTREEFLSLTAFDIDPVIDQATPARLNKELAESGSLIFESVHRRKDGSTFPVEINAKNIRLERNYRLSVVRDIAERKRAEAALRDAERKYRDIFENAGEGIFQSTFLRSDSSDSIAPINRIICSLRTERPGLARPHIGWRRHSASSSYCPHPSNFSPLTEHSIQKFNFVNPRNLASSFRSITAHLSTLKKCSPRL